MSDPAIEAAQRAWAAKPNGFEKSSHLPHRLPHGMDMIAAAREMAKPIRALHAQFLAQGKGPETECWWRAVQYVLEELAPLIHTTEELGQ
ncbi:hypothetical protein [Mycolicibacterium houstonense]|uniref:hypothetical protein n=1 Tax=Mycolicibacterium houstonense TaxID=146021 RepID=UPI000B1E6C6D|nr:hypothetical protein [Mycolicibacterium houstonense]